MASIENTGVDANNNIPSWITQQYFEKIITDEFGASAKIVKFKPEPGSAAGENYASVMLRILIDVEKEDGSIQEFPLMMKTTHAKDSLGNQMIEDLDVYYKENEAYDTIIPAFEKLYSEKGKRVVFGPRSFKLSKDPGVKTVVLEDLRPKKFKNVNRVEGLDMDHTKSVLKILAEFHAASAVHYETVGPYKDKFNVGMFDPSKKEMLLEMFKTWGAAITAALENYVENGAHYSKEMFGQNEEEVVDLMIEMCRIKPEEFNVLNHGDSWCNNIMFNYTDEGKLDETVLVDFQMCKYGSPAQDLLYFIFSSPKQEFRLEKFDYMIKYYHEQLVENLKLLDYPKPTPTLRELHISILRNNRWAVNTAVGTLAIALLEITENASIDNFLNSDEEGATFKNNLYSNPKYVKCLNEILPWLESRGLLV